MAGVFARFPLSWLNGALSVDRRSNTDQAMRPSATVGAHDMKASEGGACERCRNGLHLLRALSTLLPCGAVRELPQNLGDQMCLKEMWSAQRMSRFQRPRSACRVLLPFCRVLLCPFVRLPQALTVPAAAGTSSIPSALSSSGRLITGKGDAIITQGIFAAWPLSIGSLSSR